MPIKAPTNETSIFFKGIILGVASPPFILLSNLFIIFFWKWSSYVTKSIKKTKKAVIVEEDHKTGGMGAEIVAQIQENCFYDLDAPILRIAGEDVPIPYNRKLELASIPTPEKIVKKILKWKAENGI